MMWLKINYPLQFYAALLEKSGDQDKVKKVIKEIRNEKIEILPVHINKSKAKYSIEGNAIRLGVENVTGIGSMTSAKLIRNQPYSSLLEFKRKNKNKDFENNTIVDKLLRIGAF